VLSSHLSGPNTERSDDTQDGIWNNSAKKNETEKIFNFLAGNLKHENDCYLYMNIIYIICIRVLNWKEFVKYLYWIPKD